jgi:hypothetical protein
MQFLLLVGNAKRLCDTFLSVHAMSVIKSGDTVGSPCQELEYVLTQLP